VIEQKSVDEVCAALNIKPNNLYTIKWRMGIDLSQAKIDVKLNKGELAVQSTRIAAAQGSINLNARYNLEQSLLRMDALAREVDFYHGRPGLAGRQFEFVYFGGGTPSFLSSQQLLRLIERINQKWTWDAAREVTFECEPGTLKHSKLKTIKEIGVTRLSLGVEHFDDEILELNGRAHKSPEVFQAYEWAREIGFPQINIDLIAGMSVFVGMLLDPPKAMPKWPFFAGIVLAAAGAALVLVFKPAGSHAKPAKPDAQTTQHIEAPAESDTGTSLNT